MVIKVQVKMDKSAAAVAAGLRGVPFIFLAEEKGPDGWETTGMVPLAFLPEIVLWWRTGSIRDFAMVPAPAPLSPKMEKSKRRDA